MVDEPLAFLAAYEEKTKTCTLICNIINFNSPYVRKKVEY